MIDHWCYFCRIVRSRLIRSMGVIAVDISSVISVIRGFISKVGAEVHAIYECNQQNHKDKSFHLDMFIK